MEYGCYQNDEEIFHCYSRKLRDIFIIFFFLELKRKAALSIFKNNCVHVLIATDSCDRPVQSSVKLHLGKLMKYELNNDIKLLRSFT